MDQFTGSGDAYYAASIPAGDVSNMKPASNGSHMFREIM